MTHAHFGLLAIALLSLSQKYQTQKHQTRGMRCVFVLTIVCNNSREFGDGLPDLAISSHDDGFGLIVATMLEMGP
jgi:hypothetical protein